MRPGANVTDLIPHYQLKNIKKKNLVYVDSVSRHIVLIFKFIVLLWLFLILVQCSSTVVPLRLKCSALACSL